MLWIRMCACWHLGEEVAQKGEEALLVALQQLEHARLRNGRNVCNGRNGRNGRNGGVTEG